MVFYATFNITVVSGLTLSTYKHLLTPLQQTTFEIIVTKSKITQNKQFLLLPQCFQFFSVTIPLFMENFMFLSRYFRSRLLQIRCMKGLITSTTGKVILTQNNKSAADYSENIY